MTRERFGYERQFVLDFSEVCDRPNFNLLKLLSWEIVSDSCMGRLFICQLGLESEMSTIGRSCLFNCLFAN